MSPPAALVSAAGGMAGGVGDTRVGFLLIRAHVGDFFLGAPTAENTDRKECMNIWTEVGGAGVEVHVGSHVSSWYDLGRHRA